MPIVDKHTYRHTLAIGGTGMLREASLALAARSSRLTSVARTAASLARLDDALPGTTPHHQLQLDWSDPDAFIDAIHAHVVASEPPDLVLAWIHDDRVALRLAIELARGGRPFRFFHVIGSAAQHPVRVAQRLLDGFDPPANLEYRQVVLGSHRTDRGRRWLSDHEISHGVLEAIGGAQVLIVVGSLDGFEGV